MRGDLTALLGPRLTDIARRGVRLARRLAGGPKPFTHPYKPSTLNFLANDICNSRCQMCLIWKKKKNHEITPDQLATVLQDELFSELRYVGISGGEPTLRADLPDLVEAVCQSAPNLRSVGVITNAINIQQVIDRCTAAAEVCRRHRKEFNLMISLDGVGAMHDRVRGRDGNFESTMAVIRHFRDHTRIPVSVGCTVVKDNVWGVDDVFELCQREGIYARFRVAEFIDRLYNTECTDVIRHFDDDERYHLALFFSSLELQYETSAEVKETYRNIRGMLFEGRPRQSGCPYQNRAVALNSQGELAYCAPKSPNLGDCTEQPAERIFLDNLERREEIIRDHCPQCIHDYHAPPQPAALARMAEEKMVRRQVSIKSALAWERRLAPASPAKLDPAQFNRVLIVGWYGTETAGDKAILGDICDRLRQANPDIQITVASLFPFVTRRTLSELGLPDLEIVETFSSDYLQTCSQVDVVIMGGGPLMGIDAVGFVLAAFCQAQESGKYTIVEGCGIGPLKAKKHIASVEAILRQSTEIRVRDRPSLEWAQGHTGRDDVTCSGDPAGRFVHQWQASGERAPQLIGPGQFACFIRELTDEYAADMSPKAFAEFNKRFESELGELIRHVVDQTGLQPVLVPMHTFCVGKDDRVFARRFATERLAGVDVTIADRIYPAQAILSAMSESPFSICMRFHSVLFAQTLGVPYVAIDYTGGGKIKGFLEGCGKEEARIDRADLADGDWRAVLESRLPAELRRAE